MLSLILSLAVSQTWQWANDPKYYSGPVIDYCRNGSDCKLRYVTALRFVSTSTDSVSIVIPTASYINFYGAASGTVGITGTAGGIGVQGTTLYSSNSGGYIRMYSTTVETNFSTPTTAGNSFAVDNVGNKLYWSNSLSWREIGFDYNPVTQQRTYTFDWSDGTPVWITGNPQTSVFGPVARTVTCVGGSEASANQTYETVRTVPARVFTTGAVINNRCSEDFALTQRPYTVILGMEGIAGVNTTATVRWIYGFQQTAIIRAPTDAPINSGAWFRYSTSAGDTNYMACSSDGVTNSCTSTGVAANTALHEFRIDMRETGVFTYWIDGYARVRKTTNLPSAGTDLAFGIGTETLAASAVAANRPRFSLWYR